MTHGGPLVRTVTEVISMDLERLAQTGGFLVDQDLTSFAWIGTMEATLAVSVNTLNIQYLAQNGESYTHEQLVVSFDAVPGADGATMVEDGSCDFESCVQRPGGVRACSPSAHPGLGRRRMRCHAA